VQDAEAHPAALPVAEELTTVVDVPVPDRLVDEEVFAVESPQRGHAVALQIAEEPLVECADPCPIAQYAEGRRDDLVSTSSVRLARTARQYLTAP